MLQGKHIVLGICGGIAAYKSVTLLRLLTKAGADVQVVMTPAAKEFITPVTLSSLSRHPVVSEFFTANTGEWHSHVDLGLWADLMIIAPATASTIGKMANGIADNMLVTTYLSAREPVMIAPAMDLDMYKHPTTRRNLDTLAGDGVSIIHSPSGQLASGLEGKGRMAEPEDIFNAIQRHFCQTESFKGKKVLITAGPTFEKIDPVRFIGNYSSGKMGFAIAEEMARRGADVTLVAGPVNLSVSDKRIRRIDVETAIEMRDAAVNGFKDSDIAVFTAAVADYRPRVYHDLKIKREDTPEQTIELVQNPDIAAECGKIKHSGQLTVGFALETDKGLGNARKKLSKKNLDIIVLNTLENKGAGFRTDTNQVTIISDNEERSYPLKDKKLVASDIADFIETCIK